MWRAWARWRLFAEFTMNLQCRWKLEAAFLAVIARRMIAKPGRSLNGSSLLLKHQDEK
jgi:hypothetical protein